VFVAGRLTNDYSISVCCISSKHASLDTWVVGSGVFWYDVFQGQHFVFKS
jgi:hypothetical protein